MIRDQTTLFEFISSRLRPDVRIAFLSDRLTEDKTWQIVSYVDQMDDEDGESETILAEATSASGLLAMFPLDDADANVLRAILNMPHIYGVVFEMANDGDNHPYIVCAYVSHVDPARAAKDAISYHTDREVSRHNPMSALHALRRRIGIDSISLRRWKTLMYRKGFDVQLLTYEGQYYALVDNVDGEKMRRRTVGETPYEALALYNVYVSKIAASEFSEIRPDDREQ